MVIAQPLTHTLYYTLYYSTIGSALIITYRHHYGIHSFNHAHLTHTHKGVGVRAEAIQSASTAEVIVGR